jgi:hypothetical protein
MIPEKPFKELSPEDQAVVYAWFRLGVDFEYSRETWLRPYGRQWISKNFFGPDHPKPDFIYRLSTQDSI